MQILFVIPAYAPFVGGAQTFGRSMVRRLAADGHQATVLTTNAQQADDFWQPPPSIRAPLLRREQMDGAQIIRLPLAYPWPAPYHFGLLRRASHLLARLPLPTSWQPSILRHFTRIMPPLFDLQSELPPMVASADWVVAIDASWDGLFVGAAQAAFAQRKPLALVPLTHTGSPAITGHFHMAHQTAAYRQADAVIALSYPEQALLAEWGVDQDKLHCLPMGVEPVDTAAARHCWKSVRQRYTLPERFILFLGAATYDKGAFTLVESLMGLVRQEKNVHIVYAGPQQHLLTVFMDTQPADVRAMLEDRVHLLDVVDEETKQALLAGCTVLALPSRVDSFGIVLLEAWQHGKPVIAADVGGPATLVTHEKTGLLVPFDDSAALVIAIQRIFDSPDLAARMGAAGHQMVTDQYTWDKCYDTLTSILRLRHAPTSAPRRKQNRTGKRHEHR